MPRSLIVFLLTCAASAVALGTALNAQENGDAVKRSRLLPPASPVASVKPPIAIVARAVPRKPEPATAEQVVATAKLCMQVVSPDFEISPRVLAADGWVWTEPQTVKDQRGSFDLVEYHKNGNAVGLADFGDVVYCRILARIPAGDLDSYRAAFIRDLSAQPIAQVPGLEALSANYSKQSPQVDQSNFLIAGSYQIELAKVPAPLARDGAEDPNISAIRVTILPIPRELRDHRHK